MMGFKNWIKSVEIDSTPIFPRADRKAFDRYILLCYILRTMEKEPNGQIERKSLLDTSRLSLLSGRECRINLTK